MKNTKKLLILLCAVMVLGATVFAVVSSAVVAGEGTTMNEYLNMFKIESEDFEDSVANISGLGVANLNNAPSQYSSVIGKIHTMSNVRKGAPNVYGEGDYSTKFFMIDYTYNNGPTTAHLYVQPRLGNLDKIEKTPIYGFVSEFDICFFSPVEIEMTEKKVQAKDPNTYELLWETDENGEPKLDESGNKIPLMVVETKPKFDTEGQPVYETNEDGSLKLDDKGNPIQATEPVMTPKLAPVLDENGEEILDANGNVVMGEVHTKLPFVGFANTFSVGMYNTQTLKDGYTDLLYFPTTAATDTTEGSIKMEIRGNLLQNAPVYTFAPDTWQHVSVQFDANNLLTSIYVGRDTDEGGRTLIGQLSAIDPVVENKGGKEAPVYPLQFRIGASSRSGIVGLDNFVSYQGTTIHDPDLVKEKLEPDEVMVKFANVLGDAAGDPVVRHQSFIDIGEYIIEDYYSVYEGRYLFDVTRKPELKTAVDCYLTYLNNVDGVLDELIANVNEANAEKFVQFVNNADAIDRTLANTSTRKVRISMASDFLTSVGVYIDRTGDTFKNANATLRALEAEVLADEASNEFITYMNLFKNAVDFGASVSRITAHYNVAKELRSSIADYTVFPASSNDYKNLKTATDYYDGNESLGIKPAEVYISEANYAHNSTRFIGIVNIIKETTRTDWENDTSGKIENLWYSALNIKRNDGVDESVEGYAAAEFIFEQIHEYFWDKMQSEHIAILNAKLNTYDDPSNSYIDKAGICTYVDNYIELNSADIAAENVDIVRIKEKNETYKAQLETLVGDYKRLLTQNTEKFINVMKYAAVLSTYAELKPVYDEASEYYYSMDIIGDNIDEYVELYEELRVKITAIESDSSVFVAIVNGSYSGSDEESYQPLAEITDKTAMYKSLNACVACTENLDDTYEGVAAAKEIYDAKYSEYMGFATQVNSQLEQTLNTTCAVRGNWDIDSIVAFVKSLFN
ncbi:MAG: hypothetical protein IKD45_01425 [Clostridia bacterium]|nr:hypothetical protein [Clostridia bacterium]